MVEPCRYGIVYSPLMMLRQQFIYRGISDRPFRPKPSGTGLANSNESTVIPNNGSHNLNSTDFTEPIYNPFSDLDYEQETTIYLFSLKVSTPTRVIVDLFNGSPDLFSSAVREPLIFSRVRFFQILRVACPGYHIGGDLRDMTASAVSSMITIPVTIDRHLTGAEAESIALQGYSFVASPVSPANPFFGGLFGLEIVPGAFNLKAGDVSVQMTGTINFSLHP